jgi:hypothetical protein
VLGQPAKAQVLWPATAHSSVGEKVLHDGERRRTGGELTGARRSASCRRGGDSGAAAELDVAVRRSLVVEALRVSSAGSDGVSVALHRGLQRPAWRREDGAAAPRLGRRRHFDGQRGSSRTHHWQRWRAALDSGQRDG